MKGELIAQGRTAEVYAWGEDKVLKLFRPQMPPQLYDKEVRAGEITNRAKMAAPHFYGGVEVDGQRGVLYERVRGESMVRAITRGPWQVARFGRLMAEIHARIHAAQAPELPLQRDSFHWDIQHAPRLDESLRQRALALLESLPGGHALCHGDFHPDNVMMTASGPLVIDWMSAKRGCPAADFARTVMILSMTTLPTGTLPLEGVLINALRRVLLRAYMRRYRQLRPDDAAHLADWLPVNAAARFNEGIPGEETLLRKMIER
jgi:aminoglycoside phosphotransferase (APT) family kinase protein